jgi:hypothetical protein
MYSQKLACCVKSNNKVLREFEDQIYLPFNSEYSIFIKNKNSVRASVKIEIDGIDVTEGVSLVVNPNDEIELERFIKNGNLLQGNKFKFIQRSEKIEKHRGTKVEDGLVRIEFQFEKIIQNVHPLYQPWVAPQWKNVHPLYQPWVAPQWKYDPLFPYQVTCDYGGILREFNSGDNINTIGSLISSNAAGSLISGTTATTTLAGNSINIPAHIDEVGITAPGSVSGQEFKNVNNFALEPQKHVIILRLLGEHKGKKVLKTVTTRSKTSCVTCGKVNKSSSAKFCSECGTSLHIIE